MKSIIHLSVAGTACVCFFLIQQLQIIDTRMLAMAGIGVATAALLYERRTSYQLPEQRPGFALFPKYRFPCSVSSEILAAADPGVCLVKRMQRLGFTPVGQTPINLRFHRGYQKGDFDAELAQVVVDISLPLAQNVEIDICYGWFALFDTGDLWRICRQVTDSIGQTDSASPATVLPRRRSAA